jgi:uncharacterized membrane protein YkvA (DUF1232 family)
VSRLRLWTRRLGGRELLALLRHLPSFLRLHVRLCRDPRVPLTAKLGLAAAVLYVLSPIDLLPDYWLALLGFADDAVVLWAASRWFIRACPPDVVREHVRQIDRERA